MCGLENLTARVSLSAVCFLLAAGLIWLTSDKIDDMTAAARAAAISERDAYWTAQIEKSNALAAMKVAEQARATLDIETAATARIEAAENQLAEMETANASLPDDDRCGLGRDRVRLLPH